MTKTSNRALWRAAHSLTHPAIVAAVIGLLLNDHWLRHVSPSWLTGKLGDLTWLAFAPLIAAIFFAVVIPRRVRNHTRIVGWLSFGAVGVWFGRSGGDHGQVRDSFADVGCGGCRHASGHR